MHIQGGVLGVVEGWPLREEELSEGLYPLPSCVPIAGRQVIRVPKRFVSQRPQCLSWASLVLRALLLLSWWLHAQPTRWTVTALGPEPELPTA